jgi:hypothetical protein
MLQKLSGHSAKAENGQKNRRQKPTMPSEASAITKLYPTRICPTPPCAFAITQATAHKSKPLHLARAGICNQTQRKCLSARQSFEKPQPKRVANALYAFHSTKNL